MDADNSFRAFGSSDRKENRIEKRFHLDSPSAILSPASRIPLKKLHKTGSPLELRLSNVINIGDPNLESTLLEPNFIGNNTKIGDRNLDMTAAEDTLGSFTKDDSRRDSTLQSEMAASTSMDGNEVEKISGLGNESYKTEGDGNHEEENGSPDTIEKTFQEVCETDGQDADVCAEAAGSSLKTVGDGASLKSTVDNREGCENLVEDVSEVVTVVESLEPFDADISNDCELKAAEQLPSTSTDIPISESPSKTDVSKLLEEKRKKVKIDHANPPSTPRSLEKYARERLSDYSFIISEAFCEKEVFCDNCYKMRVEVEKLIDKFSGLLEVPSDENADCTSVRRLEEIIAATNDRMECILKERVELQSQLNKTKDKLAAVEKEKEFVEKDLNDFKFYMELEMKKHQETTRQKNVEISELSTKVSELESAQKDSSKTVNRITELEAQLNSFDKETLALKQEVCDLTQKIGQKENRIDKLSSENKILQEKICDSKTNSVSRSEYDEVKAVLSEKEIRLNEQKEQIVSLEDQLATVKERLNGSIGMQAQLEEVVKDLEVEKNLLTDKITLLEQKRYCEDIDSIKAQLSKANAKVATLEAEASTVSEKMEKLYSERIEKDDELNKVNTALMNAKESLLLKEKQEQRLNTFVTDLKTKLAANETALKTFDQMKSAFTSALSPYVESVNTSNRNLVALKEENALLKNEIARLKDNDSEVKEYVEKVRNDKAVLEHKLSFLETLNDNFTGLCSQVQELKNELKLSNEASSKWPEEVSTLRADLNQKMKELGCCLKDKEEFEKRVSIQVEKSKHMEVENIFLKQKGQIVGLVESIKTAIDVKLDSVVGELRSEMENERKCLLKERDNVDLERCKSILEQQVTELKDCLSAAEMDKQSLISKLNDFEGRVDAKEYAAVKESLSSWQQKVSELEQVITTLRSESQILRDALSNKDNDIEQALICKTDLEKQLATVTSEKKEAIAVNSMLQNKLQEKEKELADERELMEQMSYLKDENRRLNEACDDADEEISQLRENLLKAKQRLAEVEGAQKGLTQEEILRNIGCITSQSQHLELEKDNTSVESVVESNVKTPETKKNKVRKTLPTVTASPLSSSARKQKSEQCRQQ